MFASFARKVVNQISLKSRRRDISFPTMFALGFLCSLLVGALWPGSEGVFSTHRVSEVAGAAMSKALDEMLSSDTLESLLNTTVKMRAVLDLQAASVRERFYGFKDMLPNASFGVAELFSMWQVPKMEQVLGQSERVGVRMAGQGVKAHNPVVMIPGIITTGLEVWDGEECIKSYFRQRIWGTVTMFQSLLSDPDCWARHMELNASTGLDPLQRPGFNRSIRVRPAQGFEGADFFLGGYWLWALMIEALADIGYDLNTMYMASYDWRLSFGDLERRDRYFTRLKNQIETLVSFNDRKVVVVAHSMGGNVWHYFMQWVTHKVRKTWISDNIEAEVLISSPLLGLPKAYFSLLTGDNRDFASMGSGFSAVMNTFFGAKKRRKLWRTCSSLALLMPMGGELLWGEKVTGVPMVSFRDRNLSMQEAYDLLANKVTVPEDLRRIADWLLDGVRRGRPPDLAPHAAGHVPEHLWGNVLAAPLPFAPGLHKYAFYGVGVSTEYSGVIQELGDDLDFPKWAIDKEATPDSGFVFGDGDYSCPVHTLGLMCLKGWKDERRNPASSPCTIKEYPDKPTTLLSGRTMRGGKASGDHIDLLGNDELLGDVLTIASGRDVAARIVSDIKDSAQNWEDA